MGGRYRRPRPHPASLLILSQFYEPNPSRERDLSSRTASYAGAEVLHSIEHPVYDDSGHGNIEPDRESPAGDAPVRIEAFSKGPKERDQSQRYNRRCQNSVREKNREIDQPDTTLPFERNGTDLIMVDEIRSQKKNRASESKQHARFVRRDVS